MRLCILENGLVPEELRPRFASYPTMIEHWLAPALPEARFHSISAIEGEPLPDPEEFDGYLLTGSKHSVYERTDWMQRQIEFLRKVREVSRPIFGICFGHQLMADAFGGETRKAAQGWSVGAQHYYAGSRASRIAPDEGATLVFHQDQVVKLPEEAQVVGSSASCPNGILDYAFAARSVQYHPEFSPDYIQALIDRYRGVLFDDSIADDAEKSLEALSVDNARVATWAAAFFRKHVSK